MNLKTSRHLPNENIYALLERLGWKRTGGNSRYDCYAKKNWRVTLSKTTTGTITFSRVDFRNSECYYADATDAGKFILLAGPFRTHQEAIDILDKVRDLAQNYGDPRAWFYSYGTCKMPNGKKLGMFNQQLGL